MKRVALFTSVFALAAFAAGCTRERVIVVKEPSGDKNTAMPAVDGKNGDQPIDGERPNGDDDSDWVQFYKATSNGAVSDIDLDSISRSIGSVYEHADAVGSLVMPDGDPRRPTAWQKVPREWFPW